MLCFINIKLCRSYTSFKNLLYMQKLSISKKEINAKLNILRMYPLPYDKGVVLYIFHPGLIVLLAKIVVGLVLWSVF